MQDPAPIETSNSVAHRQLEVCIGADTATFTLNGTLTLNAQQLEDLVSSLAMVRARMQPQVQQDPPPASASEFVLNPRHAVLADPLGETIFTFIRHPMFGWIALSQTQDEAMHMVLALAGQLKLLEDDIPTSLPH